MRTNIIDRYLVTELPVNDYETYCANEGFLVGTGRPGCIMQETRLDQPSQKTAKFKRDPLCLGLPTELLFQVANRLRSQPVTSWQFSDAVGQLPGPLALLYFETGTDRLPHPKVLLLNELLDGFLCQDLFCALQLITLCDLINDLIPMNNPILNSGIIA